MCQGGNTLVRWWQEGIMRRLGLLGLTIIWIISFVVPCSAERRVALIIGNSSYQYAPSLVNSRNDAEDVAASLQRAGFEVILGLNLDKAGMDDFAARFARAARTADV